MGRPQRERDTAKCLGCGYPVEDVIMPRPVSCGFLKALEIWYCMECQERFIFALDLETDEGAVAEYRSIDPFRREPSPWGDNYSGP